jgi:hypothetical protein
MDQTNEQQRTFNEWAISELHEEVDSIKTSLNFKTTLYPPAVIECRLCLSARGWGGRVLNLRDLISFSSFHIDLKLIKITVRYRTLNLFYGTVNTTLSLGSSDI